jgi:phospholipid/cholesterol/gamma-HCH transport system substrate-binding protein
LNEFKVGLLTLLAMGSLVIVSVKISTNKNLLSKFIEYKTIVDDASGIFEKSSIKVAGINAGKINKIELQDSKALITFEITSDIKITANSKLQLKSVGFLGDKYLDIYLGSPNAERLKEGSLVTASEGAGFEQLGKDASDVLADVKEIARAIKESMIDEQQQNVIKKITENILAFTEHANEVAQTLKVLVVDNETKLTQILNNIERISKQLAFESDRYQDGSLMNDFEGIRPLLDNVNLAMIDLKDMISDVKAGKGSVGKLMRDDEIVDQVSQTLSGINRIVNRVTNFKTDISIYSGVNTEYGGHTQFDLDLIPAPERFFRIGMVTNQFGPAVNSDKTITTTDEDGDNKRVVNRNEVDNNAFKFNLQVGRRFNDLGVRAGLIETTGGFGIDYSFLDNGLKTTMEIFDYRQDIGPNLRLLSEIRVWNVFYSRLSGEDLIGDGQQSYTISAGIKFNDEDLAALIGFIGI